MFGMPPAEKRLGAHHGFVGQAHLWLIMDFELATLEGFAKLMLDVLSVFDLMTQVRLVEGDGAGAALLGAVESEVGMTDEPIDLVAMIRRDGDSNAGVDPQLLVIHDKAFVEVGSQAFRNDQGGTRVRDV